MNLNNYRTDMEKGNLAKAVIQVMKAVKGIEKNSNVGSGNHSYKGTKDQDVKEAFNEALTKAGLCILPISVEDDVKVERWEQGGYMKQSVFTSVKTKYLLLHESGESMEIAGYGHGVDAQDKGAGKATTYALKYALLYTFLTPVGKIDDSDQSHSEEMPIPQKRAPTRKPNLIDYPGKWAEAVKFLKNGGAIEDIKSKYTLSEKDQEKLIEDCNG